MTPPSQIERLIVIGLGLIGGSFSLSLKAAGGCKEVIGVAVNDVIGQEAQQAGLIDQWVLDLSAITPAPSARDVIFIAVPTLAVRSVLEAIKAANVGADVTITDGASVKGSVERDAIAVFGEVPSNLVLGHPIAGSEKSGVSAAKEGLFDQHRVILTPLANTDHEHFERVRQLWQTIGAEVLTLDVANHDAILGATSHLPHVIAFSLVDTLAHDSHNEDIFRYAAGGFRDFTRIASSDVTMWRDIMLANRDAVIDAIDLFSNNLAQLRSVIADGDSEQLTEIFGRAKTARDAFIYLLDQKENQR